MPLKIGKEGPNKGVCAKECDKGEKYMYIKIVEEHGHEKGFCTRKCPKNFHFSSTANECLHPCIGGHYDHEGYC